MRKRILVFAMLFISMTGKNFAANPDKVESKVLALFKKQFGQAENIQWQTSIEFDKATFIVNGEKLVAFYDHSGELYALSRNIMPSQLPIKLLLDLNKNYSGYTVIETAEIIIENEAHYYIKIDNSWKKIILENNGDNWTRYAKEK